MSTEKCKKVMISVYREPWEQFVKNCKKQYKTASGVIRELIIQWNDKKGKESNRKERK